MMENMKCGLQPIECQVSQEANMKLQQNTSNNNDCTNMKYDFRGIKSDNDMMTLNSASQLLASGDNILNHEIWQPQSDAPPSCLAFTRSSVLDEDGIEMTHIDITPVTRNWTDTGNVSDATVNVSPQGYSDIVVQSDKEMDTDYLESLKTDPVEMEDEMVNVYGATCEGEDVSQNLLQMTGPGQPQVCTSLEQVFLHPTHAQAAQSHPNIPDKSYACDFCNKSFKYSINLDFHARLHTDNNLYGCIWCTKKFENAKLLYEHFINEHTQEKPQLRSQEIVYPRGVRPQKIIRSRDVRPQITDPGDARPQKITDTVRPKIITESRDGKPQNITESRDQKPYKIIYSRDVRPQKIISSRDVRSEKITTYSKDIRCKKKITDPRYERPTKITDSIDVRPQKITDSRDVMAQKLTTDSTDVRPKMITISRDGTPQKITESRDVRPRITYPQVYRCKMCDLTFKDYHELCKHMVKIKHGCCSLNNLKRKDNSMRILQNTKMKSQLTTCALCLHVFHEVDLLLNHIIHVHPKLDCYDCYRCGEQFDQMELLREHLITDSNVCKRPYRCVRCGLCFNSFALYEVHQPQHDLHLPLDHECSTCGLTFKQQYWLTDHVKEHL